MSINWENTPDPRTLLSLDQREALIRQVDAPLPECTAPPSEIAAHSRCWNCGVKSAYRTLGEENAARGEEMRRLAEHAGELEARCGRLASQRNRMRRRSWMASLFTAAGWVLAIIAILNWWRNAP